MHRVLFVDDEPRLLEGLRRALWPHRSSWDLCFAASGPQALALMSERPADVVVADFRMPGMNGLQLLKELRLRWPDAARLVLSGHTDEAALLKVVTVAHQFLTKPCDTAQLVAAIERALWMRDRLNGEQIRAEIGGVETLPTPPSTLHDLMEVLESPESRPEDVAAVVERDVALTVRLLQLANSTLFSSGPNVSCPGEAVARLGLQTVRSVVLMKEIARPFDLPRAVPPPWLERLNRQAALVGRLAQGLAHPHDASDAFCAGVVQECGQLVLAACRPEVFQVHLDVRARDTQPLGEIETRTFGVTHSRAGAYLLSLWGFPLTVVHAVATHDQPLAEDAMFPFSASEAVQLAHQVAEHDLAAVCGAPGTAGLTDEELAARGALEPVRQWRDAQLGASSPESVG